MRTARNITEVLEIMDEGIEKAHTDHDRRGYFLALYRAVTRRVAAGIEAGTYDDGPRMDRFDTHFANRYFEACAARDAGQPTTRAWRVALDASGQPHLCILQHLVLGMNAHINLDLAISAAAVCPGPTLPALAHDFERINDVLIELLDEAQAALGRLSPTLRGLDRVGGRADEIIAGFSLKRARGEAWESAEWLAAAADQAAFIERLDRRAHTLGRLVVDPGGLANAVLRVVRMWEERDVRRGIEILAELR